MRQRDRWLLIYDNAEDAAALAPWLPGGQVLITSRDPGWGNLATPVPVDLFARAESTALLRRRVPRLTDTDADRIAVALGDLPLALDQAAAHLALFTAHPDQLPGPLATAARDPLAFTDLTHQLRRRALARVAPDTLHVHQLSAALLRTRPCPPDQAGAPPVADQAPRDLPAFPVHPATGQDLPTLAVRLLRTAVPDGDPRANPQVWPIWRQFLPHVLVATDRNLTEAKEDVAWLLHHAASYLRIQGEPARARPLFERARKLRRSMLGDDHRDTLDSTNSLSLDLWELGKYEPARQLGEDTLARFRRVLGEDHPATLTSASNLATDLRALGREDEADKLEEWVRSRR